ncbi:MAG: hypothetical protein JWO82_2422, partial [Akkermansiaceae bacterium]|nr:hypothetical protein [Akkermansiaceae bacterium]
MKAPTPSPRSFRAALLAALLFTPAASLLAQQPVPTLPTPPPAAAPEIEADPADSGDSITREIEQRVLLKQCQTAAEALVELAQAATDNSDPAETKRIETAVTRNAGWLARLQQDLKKSGADPDEVQDELNASAGTLNEAAWEMLTSGDDPAASHPELALKLATTAVELLSAEDPEQRPRFLDTRARALFMTGQHD